MEDPIEFLFSPKLLLLLLLLLLLYPGISFEYFLTSFFIKFSALTELLELTLLILFNLLFKLLLKLSLFE